MTEDEARRRLEEVIDPELGVDIVELGLVYDVAVTTDHVRVVMTLTTQGCPLHDVLADGVHRALATPNGPAVEVEVVFDPPWTPDRIGPRGRELLGVR